MKKPRILFAVADGEHARIVASHDEGKHHETLVTLKSADAGKPGHAHGRSFESVGGHRHQLGAPDNADRKSEAKFAQRIAEKLDEALAEHRFDRLVLVAPPHMLAFLRDALRGEAKEKLAGELTKDLTKVPDHELGGYLRALGLPVLG